MYIEEIKRGLRAEIKKRENEQYCTCETNIRQMCKDVLAKIEEQESVIAELKNKINEAQTELELWRDGSIISEAHQKELDGKRHSDYKRCLAMAEWCKSEQTYSSFSIYVTEHPKSRWASRSVPVGAWFVFWKNRERRWLTLADKYKEGK